MTASPGGSKVTVSGSTTTTTVSGLSAGTSYTFTLTATNGVGTGSASAPSNAVVPSASTATLGDAVAGTTIDSGDSDVMNGSRFTTGSSGSTVSSMSVYVGAVDSTAGHNQFQVAIYADANGAPGALLAQSGSGTLTANSWNTLALSASLKANTAYWLMYNTNGTSGSVNGMGYTSGGQSVWSNHQSFGSWPSKFGHVAGSMTASFSIYATYTPTTAGLAAPTMRVPSVIAEWNGDFALERRRALSLSD
jgi:hypothetical protein